MDLEYTVVRPEEIPETLAAENEEKKEADQGEKRSSIRVQKLYDEEEDRDEENGWEGRNHASHGVNAVKYDSAQHEWIKKQHHGNLIMEETENMWTPVKRFLNRRKKPKWGDWDGLYIEEEEI